MDIGDIYKTKYNEYTVISKFSHPTLDKDYLVIQDNSNPFNISVVLEETNSQKEDNNG